MRIAAGSLTSSVLLQEKHLSEFPIVVGKAKKAIGMEVNCREGESGQYKLSLVWLVLKDADCY